MPQSMRHSEAEPAPSADTTIATAAMPLAVAEELDGLARRIVALGDALAEDGDLVARHMIDLQDIDCVAQMLGALATVLRADQVDATLDELPVRELALRLIRRLRR